MPGSRHLRPLLLIASLALVALLAACSDPQTTVDPKSDFADQIQGVYVIVFWLAVVVFVGVLALTLILAVWFRERPGREARQIHGNTRLEVVWTLIPVVIVVIMAVPTWKVIADTTGDAPEGALQVQAIGRQWWFEFRYDLNKDGMYDDLVTANELHLPAGQPVYVTVLSKDVIHSFWVPQLAGKVDMVPGHENDLWFTPDEDAARADAYLGQCAEFCGTSHANMRFRVFVDTPADFDAWVANQQADAAEPTSDLAKRGQELFLMGIHPRSGDQPALIGCVSCHTVSGTSAAGVVGPNLTHVGSRSTIAAGVLDNDIENLVTWISNPGRVKPGIDNDKEARFMPAFEEALSPDDIRAIATYLSELK